MKFSILTVSPCRPEEVHFDLLLLTDGKGHEVSWSLKVTERDNIMLSGSGYSSYSQNNVVECIPLDCYTFLITDSNGDGLCCDYGYGEYSIRLNGLKLASGSSYGFQDEVDLRCLLVPTMPPTHEVRFIMIL